MGTCITRLFWPAGLILYAVATTGVAAESPFNGTWRPDPQKPPASQAPDVYDLSQGMYACQSCKPPYSVKSDGAAHPIPGNPYYDSVSVTLIDSHTVKKSGKKGGKSVVESTMVVSADGGKLTESRSIYGMGPQVMEVTSTSVRLSKETQEKHPLSGSWRLLETDLTHHDEDTTFNMSAGTLAMSDHMGRSFKAKLDGTDSPYRGDSEFDTVSLKVIDSRTIEEYDKKAGKVAKISRWAIGPDGNTIHVQFDDTHGKVQEQSGHKLEGTG